MKTYLFTLVKPREPTIERKLVQLIGLPTTYSEYIVPEEGMGWPRVLIIEQNIAKDEGIFLFRHKSDGSFAGDTWHETLEDAKHQADFEYKGLLEEWREVPVEISEIADIIKNAMLFKPEQGK